MENCRRDLNIEIVPIETLKPHPRNYRSHPDDQIAHIAHSIKTNGFYRNVVISQDDYVLAGHGVVLGAKKNNLTEIPVVRMPFPHDDIRAIKLLTADNEISHLAEDDDRLLSELLKEVQSCDIDGLLGTGYDEMMLANLVYVTRPKSEIRDFDDAALWVGLPEYQEESEEHRLYIRCDCQEDIEAFVEKYKTEIHFERRGRSYIGLWPDGRHDMRSIRFEVDDE